MMLEFLKGLLEEHGERLTFMALATLFGVAFLKIGLSGAGETILIAVATLALNKARGPKDRSTTPPDRTPDSQP
jgi:hypothetical protein